jgi:hypothetical protein
MPKYKIQEGQTVRSAGKFHQAGAVLDLSEEEAEGLIASGHVQPVATKPEKEPGKPRQGGGAGD